MKLNLKKTIGIANGISLEHRVLNIVSVVGTLTSLLAIIINYVTDLPIITVYVTSAITLIYILLFIYSVTFKNFKRYYYLIFTFIVFFVLPSLWFVNGGSVGGIPYYVYFSFVIINITSKDNANVFFSASLLIILMAMVVVEFYFPQTIIGYATPADRLIDLLISIIITILLIFYSIKVFMREYRRALKTEIENKILLQEQNAEIEAQRNEIELHKIEIEKSHESIISSISYAQRIQSAVLPKKENISMVFPEHFVYFKPRDIVSGDFYFMRQHRVFTFFCVADCTGHGVPGAFMSMLGIALLNEIITKPEIQNAAQALDQLREQIKNALQQTGQMDEQKDGMDIAFCCIDNEKRCLSFAGAYNSLFFFRNSELMEIKADNMPIGIYPLEKSFTNNEIQLQNNDLIYMFTDGYHSQFKETTLEKIKYKRFKMLIEEIQHIGMDEQKQKLDTYLHLWKGKEAQVDDILVAGLKITFPD